MYNPALIVEEFMQQIQEFVEVYSKPVDNINGYDVFQLDDGSLVVDSKLFGKSVNDALDKVSTFKPSVFKIKTKTVQSYTYLKFDCDIDTLKSIA